MVDPREVEELERAPQPLDPPAVAAALQRRPVVERVAPQLALVGEGVGRRAGDERRPGTAPGARGGRRCPARRRSGRRRSAARRARRRRRAAPSTRGRSGPGRRPRRAAANSTQSSIQYASRSRKSSSSACDDRAPAARRAAPARRRTPTPPCRASRGGPAGPSGSICHHVWPAVGEPVDPGVGAPRRGGRSGSEVGCSWTPLENGRSITRRLAAVLWILRLCRMPDTKGSEPPRIVIQYPAPAVDGGRYPAKRCVGDTVAVTADVFRDGHEILRAVVRYRGARAAAAGSSRRCAPIDAHINGVRWEGEFPVDDDGPLGVRDRGVERRLRHLARRAAAQGRRRRRRTSPASSPRASCCSSRPRARAKGADKKTIERALAVARTRRPSRRARRRARPELFAAMERASERPARATLDTPARASRSTASRARFGSWYELFPRSLGRPEGGRGADPRDRRARLRRPLPPADPPDRRQEPQGPQQRARRRPGRPRLAVRDRRRARAATTPSTPSSARMDDVRSLTRHRARARHGRRARPRAQRVGRPPVADRAPGVVPAAPRRHAQVRREPAQALPGHLQLQLGHAGLARAVAGVARRRHPLGRRRRQVLPRRQPAHQAVPVLGVADRGGPRASTATWSSSPRRSPAAPSCASWRRSASPSPTRTSPGRTRAGS